MKIMTMTIYTLVSLEIHQRDLYTELMHTSSPEKIEPAVGTAVVLCPCWCKVKIGEIIQGSEICHFSFWA